MPFDIDIPSQELQALYDALPDVVFFIKDAQGRYTHCNLTLMRRLGRKQRADVLGRTTVEVFPQRFGDSYQQQDLRVLRGEIIENQLGSPPFPQSHAGLGRSPSSGRCCRPARWVGLIGISRDLGQPDNRHSTLPAPDRKVGRTTCEEPPTAKNRPHPPALGGSRRPGLPPTLKKALPPRLPAHPAADADQAAHRDRDAPVAGRCQHR